ncbi:dual specificity phosphatase 28-like [Galendromus occidentalis]|uniref:Dual specificity phosphatase 28-like n=1 Tax=Galendromus occidentalis TaxID=34638 RepID=A0AAJ7SGK8_9ACAR|nr:dual specificity phosphatase 28-like [Galendromus occidentalis]
MYEFDEMSQITESLYLSGVGGLTAENIEKNEISHIVNCTKELLAHDIPGVTETRFPLFDLPTEDIKKFFHSAADLLNQKIKSGGKVVVHCFAGKSRSTSIVLAYLMKHRGMSLREAFLYVRDRRSIAEPNLGFFRQLIEFEGEIHASPEPSVKMVKLSEHVSIPDVLDEVQGLSTLHPIITKRIGSDSTG